MPANVETWFSGIDRKWHFKPKKHVADSDRKATLRQVEKIRHRYANRPTQSAQGTITLWVIALCHHGEYVELQAPEYWCQDGTNGLIFPDAANWQFNEGNGPGGKPFQTWICNTVHDSTWLDGAKGTLEPAMMLIHRRSNGVPSRLLLSADIPWRVEAECGPDFGHLYPYDKIAKKFGLNPIPDR
jgi:hypothetical protein